MENKLKLAIEHAKEFLKLYQGIPTGAFGSMMIQKDLSEAEEILENIGNYKKSVIEYMIKKLWKIE